MNTSTIEKHFATMGARFEMKHLPAVWNVRTKKWVETAEDYAMDIAHDRHGAFFELRVPSALRENLHATVMQTDKRGRHLLLLVHKNDGGKVAKNSFLCGHDERDSFVAAVPGGASSVAQAKEARKRAPGLNGRQRDTRANRAFRRQGEWFFIEEPRLVVDAKLVLRNEPLSRGRGSKPHLVAELYRTGGELVFVHQKYPRGASLAMYQRSISRGETQPSQWRQAARNAVVYVRGMVRHADHQTITLHAWHRVVMNTENESRTMANVAFLD